MIQDIRDFDFEPEKAEKAEKAWYPPENPEKTENPIKRSSDFSGISGFSAFSGISAFSGYDVNESANRLSPTRREAINYQLFRFAKELLGAFPGAAAEELEPYFEVWYKVAKEHIPDLEWGDALLDFEYKLSAVKFPAGTDPFSVILREVDEMEPPACSTKYGGKIGRLIHILQRLQLLDVNSPIFMSQRMAGKILGTDKNDGKKKLQQLVTLGILKVDETVKCNEFRAKRYRYLGDL